jgi:hypothetical protein
VLFATPLWYANAVHFRAQLHDALARGVGHPRVVVLDAIGMSDLDYTGAVTALATRAPARCPSHRTPADLETKPDWSERFPRVVARIPARTPRHPCPPDDWKRNARGAHPNTMSTDPANLSVPPSLAIDADELLQPITEGDVTSSRSDRRLRSQATKRQALLGLGRRLDAIGDHGIQGER